MANRDDLARNILHRLTGEFLANEMQALHGALHGKLEMLITEMLLEEIDQFDINQKGK